MRLTSRTPIGLVLAACLSVSAGPAPDRDWERLGCEAFADGRFHDAVEAYQHAEQTSDDPGRAALNRGVALYQLGKFREAEQAFRAAAESAGPDDRLTRARFNLGLSLLQVSKGMDLARLAEAIDCFGACRETPELADDARHNLELAKQFWRSASDEAPPDPKPPPGDDGSDPPREANSGNDPNNSSGSPNQARGIPTAGPGDGMPQPTNHAAPAGAGRAPPLPESEREKPQTPAVARELLRQAAERIERERRAMKRVGGQPAAGYPDW